MNKKPSCPICEKAPADAYKPFCSKRCADVDLNRWLSGGYAVPGSDDDSEGASEAGAQDQAPPLPH